MNYLVKVTRDEDGIAQPAAKWHLMIVGAGSPMAACTGEVVGYGEGRAEYEKKKRAVGGITCPECLALIKWYKAIKL